MAALKSKQEDALAQAQQEHEDVRSREKGEEERLEQAAAAARIQAIARGR